jgi:hypothetical protein
VEKKSEVEELAVLENYLILDDVTSESEATETTEPSRPRVFDSHFHLDRSSRTIWGKSHGHSVEELIEYSLSKVSYRPSLKVEVVGGVVVYSKPKMYPEVDFTMHGPWKVAVGGSPQAL